MSFYGEDTLKQRKQIILDTYEDVPDTYTPKKDYQKRYSYAKNRLSKPKTPVLKLKQ